MWPIIMIYWSTHPIYRFHHLCRVIGRYSRPRSITVTFHCSIAIYMRTLMMHRYWHPRCTVNNRSNQLISLAQVRHTNSRSTYGFKKISRKERERVREKRQCSDELSLYGGIIENIPPAEHHDTIGINKMRGFALLVQKKVANTTLLFLSLSLPLSLRAHSPPIKLIVLVKHPMGNATRTQGDEAYVYGGNMHFIIIVKITEAAAVVTATATLVPHTNFSYANGLRERCQECCGVVCPRSQWCSTVAVCSMQRVCMYAYDLLWPRSVFYADYPTGETILILILKLACFLWANIYPIYIILREKIREKIPRFRTTEVSCTR